MENWNWNAEKDALESVYQELKESDLPVVIWGLGSMSIEVEKRLEENGISAEGLFINVDPEKAHKIPRERKIFTIEELAKAFPQVNVVMGHGHYEMRDTLRQYSFVHKVYIIANPYLQYRVTGMAEYISAHEAELKEICALLADEVSIEALRAYCAVCATNNIEYLFDGDFCTGGMFEMESLHIGKDETYLDVGAWEGDSIRGFLKQTGGAYKHIYGVEPDPDIFPVLRKNMEKFERIDLYQYGLGKVESSFFIENKNTQSARLITAKEKTDKTEILVKTMDTLFPAAAFSLIKIGVPFMFQDILEGGEQCIRRSKPRLIINVAADNEFKLFDTIRWIANLNIEYHIALRFDFPMPTRLQVYAF